MSIDSSESELSSSSSDSSSSNLDSEGDQAALDQGDQAALDQGDQAALDQGDQAALDQAELDLYDARIAKAHEIVERRRREWGLSSNSELSALASSQLNGIEGNNRSGDVEMGGVDCSPADQGIRISPRRTRSGKVRK